MSNQVILASLDLTPAAVMIEHVYGNDFRICLNTGCFNPDDWESIKDLCLIASGKSRSINNWQQDSVPFFFRHGDSWAYWHVAMLYNHPEYLKLKVIAWGGTFTKLSRWIEFMPLFFAAPEPYLSKVVKFK